MSRSTQSSASSCVEPASGPSKERSRALMNLTVNMLFQWPVGADHPRIERILWIEQGGSRIVTIDIQDKKAWPVIHDRAFLEERFASGEIHQVKSDPFQYLRQMDEAFKLEYR